MPFGALKDVVEVVHCMAWWVYVSFESVRILSPCFKPSLHCDGGTLSPSRVVAVFPSRYLYRCCISTLLQSRIYIYFWSLYF